LIIIVSADGDFSNSMLAKKARIFRKYFVLPPRSSFEEADVIVFS